MVSEVINNKQNLTELGSEKKKEVLLALVERVVMILEKNNLCFFMYYGTLLGSVRHQGFIPWDDDIDFAMPRSDYDKLKQIDWVAEGLELLSPQVSRNCPYRLTKVVDHSYPQVEEVDSMNSASGINIDIFPIDVTGSFSHRKLLFFLAIIHSAKVIKISRKRPFYKNLMLFLVKFATFYVSVGRLTQLIDRLSSSKMHDEGLMGNCSGVYGAREIVQKRNFGNVTKLKFDSIELPAPIGYDCILKSIYGNYWILPPLDKRLTHHATKAFVEKKSIE